jgi:hypothetical protein
MKGPIEELKFSLAKFSWDSEEDLVILKRKHLLIMLYRFLRGELSSLDLEDWAEAIECREDIAFEEPYQKLIGEIIFKLANPKILAGGLSRKNIELLISELN